MAQLLGPDGRPFVNQRPASADFQAGEWYTQSLTDRWTDATEAGEAGHLKSFDAIYRSQPVVAAVVDKLARRVATLPFGGFRQDPSGAREQVLDDALASLIRRPWPRASVVSLNHFRAQSLMVHGNALLAKLRTHGDRDSPPDMLWPLDWSHVGAYGQQGMPIEWWSTTQFGDERFIHADDVVHYAWAAPSGSQIGVSPLEKLGVTLRLDDATQRYQTASFRNGNRPSLAIVLEQPRPSKELLGVVRESIDSLHKGVDQAGKTILLGAGAKAQPLSLNPVEVALIDQRKLNRDEVGMVYDLSGPLMNALDHGTMANVQELLKSLYRDVIPPWTELLVQTDQAQLLDPEPAWLDRVVRFDYTDKLKGDPKELAETLKTEVEAGLRTRNEARRVLGLPPDGDPDDPDNPANQLTLNANNQNTVQSLNPEPGQQVPQIAPQSDI